jgi:tetratricopeptide (TPR) repeat protein
MMLTIYKQQGQTPVGRGALYRQFVDLLLQWGDDRRPQTDQREALARLWPEPLTKATYRALAWDALATFASSVSFTHVSWREAQQLFATTLAQAYLPEQAATALLEDLTHRGILRYDVANRVSFFHHTFQEYFHALQLRHRSVEELIPKTGVAAIQREAIMFLAGLLDDTAPLVQQALAVDPLLAFDIVRDAPTAVPAELTQQLAKKLWSECQSGSVVGDRRLWAILFKRLAALLNKSVETLVAEAVDDVRQDHLTVALMQFYAELGDRQAHQRVLAKAMKGNRVPKLLLFEAAESFSNAGDYKRAINLYIRYLKQYPSSSAAFANRALCYKALGRNEEALADYQRAIELNGESVDHTNYAVFLHSQGRKDEAYEHLHLALQKDPTYADAHSFLAGCLESEDPETALAHYDQAVRYAPHEEDLRVYLAKFANLQEKLSRHADAMQTLRRMIALDPTSPDVLSWKQRIAACRQALDAQARTRSVREQLQEQGELPLPRLVVEWLQGAGLQVEHATSSWVLARGRRDVPGVLPVVLLPEPRVTAVGLRTALEAVRAQAWRAKQIIVATSAETLELETRHQWAALQDELTLGLINVLEIRDVLLQSNIECGLLLDRVLHRAGRLDDPFDYKGWCGSRSNFSVAKPSLAISSPTSVAVSRSGYMAFTKSVSRA